jgi:small subunit ribosomal protein S18
MARRFGGAAKGGRLKRKKKKVRFHEQAKCRFCRDKAKEVDYKDIGTLSKLVTQQGKMFSRKRSGNCAAHQRSFKRAIKRARFLALMPYVA